MHNFIGLLINASWSCLIDLSWQCEVKFTDFLQEENKILFWIDRCIEKNNTDLFTIVECINWVATEEVIYMAV